MPRRSLLLLACTVPVANLCQASFSYDEPSYQPGLQFNIRSGYQFESNVLASENGKESTQLWTLTPGLEWFVSEPDKTLYLKGAVEKGVYDRSLKQDYLHHEFVLQGGVYPGEAQRLDIHLENRSQSSVDILTDDGVSVSTFSPYSTSIGRIEYQLGNPGAAVQLKTSGEGNKKNIDMSGSQLEKRVTVGVSLGLTSATRFLLEIRHSWMENKTGAGVDFLDTANYLTGIEWNISSISKGYVLTGIQQPEHSSFALDNHYFNWETGFEWRPASYSRVSIKAFNNLTINVESGMPSEDLVFQGAWDYRFSPFWAFHLAYSHINSRQYDQVQSVSLEEKQQLSLGGEWSPVSYITVLAEWTQVRETVQRKTASLSVEWRL